MYAAEKAGSSQVILKKAFWIHQLLLQGKKEKARKRLKQSTFGQNRNHPLTKIFLSIDGVLFGAGGRTRTDTVSLPRDFKSLVSADFTTAAKSRHKIY